MAEEKSDSGAILAPVTSSEARSWTTPQISSVLEARRRKRKSTEGRDDNPLSVGGISRIPALSFDKRSFRFAQTRFYKTSRAGILHSLHQQQNDFRVEEFSQGKRGGLQGRKGQQCPKEGIHKQSAEGDTARLPTTNPKHNSVLLLQGSKSRVHQDKSRQVWNK